VYVCLCAALIAAASFRSVVRAQQEAAPGGFVESVVSVVTRPFAALLTSLALPARGRFTFPPPYSTTGIRLTNAADCGGADCVTSVGYSYWRNINNHAGSNVILVALTLDRRKGGGGPTLFSYDKTTGETRNLGPLFDASSPLSWGTGEGWYFSATLPTTLYVNSGPQILRYDVLARTFSTVVDITSYAGPNRVVWQMQSSNDDAVHSFTVRDATSWTDLGCGVYLEKAKQFRFFPARGEYDECQIDKSGRFLVIKENADGVNGLDNVVEDLTTGAEMFLADEAGALGHSDLGYGYGVGEDNWDAFPAAVRVWRYDAGGITDGRLVFHGTDWAFGDDHVAHSNARPGVPLDQQIACSSSANRRVLPHANEIVCYRLDGSMDVLVVAPVMTDLNAPGGGSDDYTKTPKGNLDVTGEYFLWTTNMGGARQDAFMVRVPLARLGSAPSNPTRPAPGASDSAASTAPPPPPPMNGWTNPVNAAITTAGLQKTTGCDGCPDAGAVSAARLTAGDGKLEIGVGGGGLRFVGLGRGAGLSSGVDLPFAFRLAGAIAEVREYGGYVAEIAVAPGDVLSIAIAGRRVQYAKNGVVFYTSTHQPSYPLSAVASLYAVGAVVPTPSLQGR
jgi:hypothetical protein